MGLFYCPKFSKGIADMSDLSNEQVLANWQECNRENRPQGADYWHSFMAKRARRGGKDAEDAKKQVAKMDSLK